MIKYLYDKEQIYKTDLRNQLRSYNKSFTGEKAQLTNYFYVTDNGKLVGSIQASLDWDWVGLSNVYYENNDILQLLLSKVCEVYKDISIGLNIRTDVKPLIDDFVSLGFKLIGCVEGTPKTKSYYYADLSTFNIKSDLSLNVITSKEMIDEYNKIVIENTKANNKENVIPTESRDHMIVALDDGTFIGGIHGIIINDSMHINLLYVNGEYRKKNIGTRLMTMIEDVAINTDVKKIFIGTVEFQARFFYEKLGYKVVLTRKDLPKGFENYKLVKCLINKYKEL